MTTNTKTRIVLVGCASQKLGRPAPARDLYVSDLFRKASAYAEATGAHWFILSAKHGLVHPDAVLEPYDAKLGTKTSPPVHQWAKGVVGQLAAQMADLGLAWSDVELVLLAGAQYAVLAHHLPAGDKVRVHVEEPLKGLGIGQRLSWLKRELEDLGAPAYVTTGATKPAAPAPVELRPLSHLRNFAERADVALCGERLVPNGGPIVFAGHVDGTGCDECVRLHYSTRPIAVDVEQLPPAPTVETTVVDDVLERIGDTVAQLAKLEERTRAQVLEARAAGASWSTIGGALGVSKQAAAKRFGALEWAQLRTELRGK